MIKKVAYLIALPLLATAIVGADSLRTHSLMNTAASIRAIAAPQESPDAALGRTFRTQYIRLNANGQVTGLISAIDNATGAVVGVGSLDVFLVQRSDVKAQTVTDSFGRFITPSNVNILPGTYTLCVAGNDGFLAYGVHIVEGSDALPVPQSNETDTAQKGPFANTSFAKAGKQQEEITAAVIPPEFSVLQEIMSQYVPEEIEFSTATGEKTTINVEKSVVEGGYQISLDANGKLAGRVVEVESDPDRPMRLREMVAFLIKDDRIYLSSNIANDGYFEFSRVEPGVYGFAAAGQDGFAALSFQAMPANALDTRTKQDSSTRYVSTGASRQENGGLNIALSPQEDIPFIRDQINRLNQDDDDVAAVVPPAGPPPFGPGPGPAGFGGPGGAAGLGEFGPLIEAGLAAWIIYEAVRSRDDFAAVPPIIQPPIVSPFVATR